MSRSHGGISAGDSNEMVFQRMSPCDRGVSVESQRLVSWREDKGSPTVSQRRVPLMGKHGCSIQINDLSAAVAPRKKGHSGIPASSPVSV